MCELLGMSANTPTDIRFSFTGFSNRGGLSGPHRDGWGISFYENRGCRTFHDAEPSSTSPLAQVVRKTPIRSRIVIAHVRRANRGRVGVENTHPFTRELWGRTWTFAHNGQLKGIKRFPTGRFTPIGTTDSEHAFCWLLNQLSLRWTLAPSSRALDDVVAEHFSGLREYGVFNALLSDGRSLYASCSQKLSMLTREAPFGNATLVDEDLSVDLSKETNATDVVTILATRPLTKDEHWTSLSRDTTCVLRAGRRSRLYQ